MSAHEVKFLRSVVQNLAKRPHSHGPITQEIIQSHGLARAALRQDELVGILQGGIGQFQKLSESILSRMPDMERGTRFLTYQTELFDFILAKYLDQSADSIGVTDIGMLDEHLAHWFTERARSRFVFVPCMISPWPSPAFSVGDINFIFIEDISKSEYYPRTGEFAEFDRQRFDDLIEIMRKEQAHWLAIASVAKCDIERGLEIANLAVDLAIVALQLAAPYLGTRDMSRLSMRRGPGMETTLSLSNGHYSGGWSNKNPGLSIGKGYLGKIIGDTQPLITAVGNCVRSFASGSFRLPNLEKVWCDAAYWLHEGLAERLDSIAVAKLETAIEVLLRAESSRLSLARLVMAIEIFFGLKEDQPITENSEVTVRQFAQGLVRDRSRILHGTWSTLNARLISSRDALEYLATTIIRASAIEIDLYVKDISPQDDLDVFLKWVKDRRQERRATEQK